LNFGGPGVVYYQAAETPLTQAMKSGAPCLLLVCSLSAFCEDGKVTKGTVTEPVPAPMASQEFKARLEWNVAPAHWEGLLGKSVSTDTVNVISSSPDSGGFVASKFGQASLSGDSIGVIPESKVERVLRKHESPDGRRLGQSDYVFRSPILEGLIPRQATVDASLGEKILNLPVVRWFRPLPMPQPPGGGKYFKWGERAESWRDYCHPAPGPGAMDNGM